MADCAGPKAQRRFFRKGKRMLKKARAEAKARSESPEGGPADVKDFAQGIRESSRQIWLAGLGAFSRAQAEGMKVFESLVEQGQNLESRTKRAASETATAAAGMAAQKAKEMQAMAGGTWDKLEQVFEDRVARALSKLGVHTQADVERLSQRVEALSEAVNELIKAGGGRPVAPSNGSTKAGKRAPRARKSTAKSSVAAPAGAKPEATTPRKPARKKPVA
jgi:poly(hydroxyalkanoate) granule-associated protein